MSQTRYQMNALLKTRTLDLHPVITDRIPMHDFAKAMECLTAIEVRKLLTYPNVSR